MVVFFEVRFYGARMAIQGFTSHCSTSQGNYLYINSFRRNTVIV